MSHHPPVIKTKRLNSYPYHNLRRRKRKSTRDQGIQNQVITGLVIGSPLDFSDILDSVLSRVASVIPYDTGSVLLIENNQVRVSRILGIGKYDQPDLKQLSGAIYDITQMANLRWIFENGQPLIISDVLDYPDWLEIEAVQHIRSWMGVPIQAHGELIGIFCLDKDVPNFYTAEHINQLNAIALQTALALKNARLFETVQRRAREAEVLRQAIAAVTTELDLDHVLDHILIQLKKVIQYDNAAILFLENEQLQIVAGSGFYNEQKAIGKWLTTSNELFRQSLVTSQPIILSDASRDDRFRQWINNERVRGWLGVPLHLRGRAVGFLSIESFEDNAYTESEATLAQAFANEVTIALENARLFKELQSLATTDPLTGIWNRRHFFHLAKIEFQRARRSHQPLSVILFDIDNFKRVNDTYGHAIGDQVLQSLANICRKNFRQADLFGRYGGEEFITLLPNTTIEKARLIAERLRELIAHTPIHTSRGSINISASVGVAEMDETCLDVDTLLIYADRAAYNAKFDGKNRVSLTSEDQDINF